MFNPKSGRIIESRDIQWLNRIFYNTNIIQSNFPETTLHSSHETNQVNVQALIPDDEALENKIALEGVIFDLDLAPTEHEVGEGEDSDEESVKSVETEVLSCSKNPKTKSGRTIRKPA